MFGSLSLIVAAFVPLILAAPTKRATPLNCVQYQYGGPFASFGQRGLIHFYANVTLFFPETQTTAFNETRLGLADNGTIQDCGDCRTTELFGFEVCQNDQRKGFDGLENSATSFYGHVVYKNVSPDLQCLTASPVESGSSLTLQECQYDYDTAASSGQYFHMTITDGVWYAFVLNEDGDPYGPSPTLDEEEPLVLYDVLGANKTFTYFGFKAPEF